jgi:hypothetical protein
MGGEYVDPKIEKPTTHIESSPIPLIYRPGIYLVIAGLAAQVVDIIVTQRFKIDI